MKYVLPLGMTIQTCPLTSPKPRLRLGVNLFEAGQF